MTKIIIEFDNNIIAYTASIKDALMNFLSSGVAKYEDKDSGIKITWK